MPERSGESDVLPYGRQDIQDADVDAVVEVLRSDFLTQGPAVPRFESAVKAYCGANHAVAVNSATSALHIACAALGLGEGDWLWTSPITFVASANCARYCGASVDFVDVDPATFNMSTDALARKLEISKRNRTLPKVVVPVHLCGQPCDMAGIGALAREYGFHVVEDASHAIGGRYGKLPVGAGEYSDITVFSFHPVKVITSGEGGAAATNDPQLADRMERLRSHGITRDVEQFVHKPHGGWYYEQSGIGFNYRLTDIHAALGLSQMGRLDDYVRRRNELATYYQDALEGLPLSWQHVIEPALSAYHLFVIKVDEQRSRVGRDELFEKLREDGVGVNIHYIPVYRQPYYERLGYSQVDFPNSEDYYRRAITIPLFPIMQDSDVDFVVDKLKSYLP